MPKRQTAEISPESNRAEEPSELLRELVAHLRQNRTQLREEWVGRISETRLLTAMTKDEIFQAVLGKLAFRKDMTIRLFNYAD